MHTAKPKFLHFDNADGHTSSTLKALNYAIISTASVKKKIIQY